MSPSGLTTQASDESPPVDKDSMAEVWLQVEVNSTAHALTSHCSFFWQEAWNAIYH